MESVCGHAHTLVLTTAKDCLRVKRINLGLV